MLPLFLLPGILGQQTFHQPGTWSDTTIEEPTKERHRQFIAGQIKQPAPTANEEEVDQAATDAFYGACGTWLREHARCEEVPAAV